MKLFTKENLEVLLIDGLTIIGVFLIGEINLPIEIYTPISLLAILYAMAKKEAPVNFFPQMFFAFALIGVVFSIAGLLFLLYDNSFIAAIIGIILGFVFAMSKENSKGIINTTINKVYDHKSRIIILPIIFNLFVLGAESLFKYKMAPGFAIIFMTATYIPVRMLFLFKPGAKWYHFFVMAVAGYFYVSSMIYQINNSPTTPVWIGMRNELGDYLAVIENDSIDGVLIEAYIAKSRYNYKISEGKYYFIVDTDSTNQWNIQWIKSDTLNKHRGFFEYERYKILKSTIISNLKWHEKMNK